MTFPCVNAIQLGPSLFNSSPQRKKSSLRHHIKRNSWKLASQKLLAQALKVMCQQIFFFLSVGACLRSQSTSVPYLEHNFLSDFRLKEPKRGWKGDVRTLSWVDESPQKDENFGTSGYPISFLAVQNSSIGDLVTKWVGHWVSEWLLILTLQSDPRDL